VAVCDCVGLIVSVPVKVCDGVTADDRVMLGVAGIAVPLTDAASLPTVKSMPQACGRVRVAEYTQVGFSLTPLMLVVEPHASVK